MYGAYNARKVADKIDADIVLFLNDFWMIKNYNVTFAEHGGSYRTYAYIPLDGLVEHSNALGDLSVLDHLVVYTQFAREEVQSALSVSRKALPISVIAHGTQSTCFRPISDQEKLRQTRKKVFKDRKVEGTPFIVLNANRSSERKDIECTLKGFSLFSKDKPRDVVLCLHQPGN